MAGNQLARKEAGAFDIDDWMSQRRADVQRLLQGAAPQGSSAGTPWDNNPLVKAGVGFAALQLGGAAGIFRAGVHSVQGMRDKAAIADHFLNPLFRFVNPRQQGPSQLLTKAASNAVDSTVSAFSHRDSLVRSAVDQLNKWNVELNPFATPQANTIGGELNRNFQIGMNQGELGADVASLAYGSAAAKVIPRLAPISRAAETAKFIDQGFEPKLARYLAEPYMGKGHHAVAPSRFKFPETFLNVPLPEALVGKPLPTVLSDSIFNVLKPDNISRGGFYQLHFQVDPEMKIARLPPRFGGAWNGSALGLQKYGLLNRIWHGSPAALNTAVGFGGLSGLGLDVETSGGEQSEAPQ